MTDTATATLDATPPAPALEAEPVRPATVPVQVTGGGHRDPPLTLSRVAELVAAANRGDAVAMTGVRAMLEAALTNVTTTDIGSIVAPAYRGEILTIIDHGTPLMNALASSPLPASGMTIEYPQWDSTAPNGGLPTTGIQATEKLRSFRLRSR